MAFQSTQFGPRLNTLRYQHTVVNCGQKLLHLTMRTLLIGDINNIGGCVMDVLGCMNSFTEDEQYRLNVGNHQTWDMCFLYKVIQRVCGLEPAGSYCWTQHTDGDGPLESLIYMLMKLRNKLAHDFELVITEDQLSDLLDEFSHLAVRMTTALGEHAQDQSREVLEIYSGETIEVITNMIEDVKREINESDDDDEDQEDDYETNDLESDNIHGAAIAEGPVFQNLSSEEHCQILTRKFWELAGHGEGA